MVELTPAVQDAAYRLGWHCAAAVGDDAEQAALVLRQCFDFIKAGADAFTPEAEAERAEAVRALGKREPLNLDDTQGRVPDSP